jgi:hypothetical protein
MLRVRPFMRKLEQLGPMGEDERRIVESLPFNGLLTYDAGQDLAREGDRPKECLLIVDGYAYRYKALTPSARWSLSAASPSRPQHCAAGSSTTPV